MFWFHVLEESEDDELSEEEEMEEDEVRICLLVFVFFLNCQDFI